MTTRTTKKNNLDYLESIPLDKTTLSQSKLDIDKKVRSNLFPWNGQFSPQLISSLVEAYAKPTDIILDPFAGSGTVLVESARHGLTAIGSDINPAPYKISSAYQLINVGHQRRKEILNDIHDVLETSFPTTFMNPSAIPSSEDVKNKLACLSNEIRKNGHLDSDSYSHLKAIVFDALILLLDFHKPDLKIDRLFACWSKLKKQLTELPYSRRKIYVFNNDARKLEVSNQSVDLVITSPPYINVFNYHQKYRRSMEAMGWNLLQVAKSEIGANRKHRQNRFLTVTQYCLDMNSVLDELCRVCKPGARMIVVVGRESNVRKTRFFNAEMIIKLTKECLGLKVMSRQVRSFTNRFGVRIFEDILHISNTRISPPVISPHQLANQILSDALEYSPKESHSDLIDAISRVNETQQSPIFNQSEALIEIV
ncbi:class I SAM-dependent methyltransferase [Rubinisphaera sp.]|uniref:class I SAM-dependent methyltransferase n=1 Tax=Rubinisphaera sp. TaxID=2024857 RepID=UPI000C0CA06A|nr:class I SAM-dependent methyltransferase [Rubinisphaera sp.]MBV12389.1 hypothetical protein [Rubinisphaera sp.]HCS50112.1 hypothetical protein [Planctomycetaceae bacterium]|tara:strand:+ start:337 stop:1608 length:1272 start_codon:yes stop_codon:yes gene_type:complete